MNTTSTIKRRTVGLALSVAVAATSAIAIGVAGAAPLGPRAAGVATADTTPLWPAIAGMQFGRGVPGAAAYSASTFHVNTVGTVSASAAAGSPTFSVTEITTYLASTDPVDPSELPPAPAAARPS